MTTTYGWATAESIATALSTGLNSLANGATALSASIDNETDKFKYINLEVYLASLTTGSSNTYIGIYILSSADGTNYEDGSAGTPGVIPPRLPDAIFELPTGNTGVLRKIKVNIPIPPLKVELLYLNNSGSALAASANTLKYRRHNELGT